VLHTPQHLQLDPFLLGSFFLLLLGCPQARVEIVSIGVRAFLQADAQLGLHAMIGVVNQSPYLSNGMKLANLMGDTRPQFRHGLSFGGLGIADHSQPRHTQSHDGQQHLFEAVFGTFRDIVCVEDSASEHIAEQRDRFIAFIGLNPIDGEKDAGICFL